MKLYIFTLTILISSCAKIVIPEGGDKDITPPKLISTSPPNGSTNIKPRKISLVFNENIQTLNLAQNLTITPDIDVALKVTSKRNKVEINIPRDSLKPAKTYSINCTNCISDLNENNIYENLNYNFSTGNLLDTLHINGTVLSIKDNVPLQKARVILTDKLKSKYSTSTDSKGQWALYNLPPGSYNLLIIKDINGNKGLDDQENYFTKNIEITDSVVPILSKLITYNSPTLTKRMVVKVMYINDYTLSVKFNSPIIKKDNVHYSINTDDLNKNNNPLRFTSRLDSALIIHEFIPQDSLRVHIMTDTLQEFLIVQPKKREKEFLTIKSKLPIHRRIDPVSLKSNIPIKNTNSEKVKILGSSDIISFKKEDNLSVSFLHTKNTDFKIILDSGAITDINGNLNKTDTILIKIASEEETGNYEFTIKDTLQSITNAVFIKVFNENSEYNFTAELNKPIKMLGLLPGKYSLELFEDANGNKKWDEGNYFDNTEPEKILLLRNFILIKPNWDTIGVDIYVN